MTRIVNCLVASAILLFVNACGVAEETGDASVQSDMSAVSEFVASNCYDCHQGGKSAEAGFDIESLASPNHADDLDAWVRIWDRVSAGEMPPRDYATLENQQVDNFLDKLQDVLVSADVEQHKSLGRVPLRRLTHLQLERTLHDLLGIDIPLADQLPEESRGDGFTTSAEAQTLSHFQLQNYLSVIDLALDEALRRLRQEDDLSNKEFFPRDIVRRNPRRRTREPELMNGKAVVWSAGVSFYGRLPVTAASESGWYRFTATVSALNPPNQGGVWCTVRRGRCVSSAPALPFVASFEAGEDPRTIEFETWLPAGHMLEMRPGDLTLKRGRFRGGQVGTGEGEPQEVPGLAIHAMTMRRIHCVAEDTEIQQNLFLDLLLEKQAGKLRIVSEQPKKDAARCMQSFARRAFRYPVDEEVLRPYVARVFSELERGQPLLESLIGGYRSLLCSPRFQFLRENPGRLDAYAVASRLSYFLWNSMPDETLLALAEARKLDSPEVLESQVERMLNDPRGSNFISDFADQWLDLRNISFTVPDRKLYPEFDLIVQQSMLSETQAFLQHLLDQDLGVCNMIDAEFSFLNNRLARYYGIAGVQGDQLQRVEMAPEHHRGGLLTQGAILKVTANGTNTSPVVRGVWVADRLLGDDIPPPPANVPAIEPDIRGANTIREMLAKHRSDESCAVCHVRIDPPGFALENFDAAGQWRDHYVRLEGRKRRAGNSVDVSYRLADGREFQSLEEFQQLILADGGKIAKNVAAKLLSYGTGAEVSFSDRRALDEIVDQTQEHDYGLRSIVKAVVHSELFLTK